MSEQPVSQRARLIILFVEIGILCLGSFFAFGQCFPPAGAKGFWFYTALLGVILGNRLDTPFFVKPADVVLYAAPAVVALLLGSSWAAWIPDERLAFVVAISFCGITGLFAVCAILTKDAKSERVQRFSNASRVLSETLGAPRVIYTFVILFALYTFHRSTPSELFPIFLSWAFTVALSPLEGAFQLTARLTRLLKPDLIFDADGEVIAFQTPGLLLIRENPRSRLKPGDFLAVNDPIGHPRLALTLDYVGRDEGLLLRAIDVTDTQQVPKVAESVAQLPSNSVVVLSECPIESLDCRLLHQKALLVGLVAPDTSIERLYFEVVRDDDLEEGRLVEVQVGRKWVTYQLVNGLTKEDIVQQKSTHGYARAQAQKVGVWDDEHAKFTPAKWLPRPNSPVFLKTAEVFSPMSEAIGHFPGTNYFVSLKNIDALVTHNTAILGILGVGKSSLAIELVERILTHGVKVICLDLTNQYATELSAFYDAANETGVMASLNDIGQKGKTNIKKNVEEGGSKIEFSKAIAQDIEKFLAPENSSKLKIYNPARFEVWKQDSKPYGDTASMASLTPTEIAQIITEATLRSVEKQGMTDRARTCLVYEEAHSLVPEWSSIAAEGDRAATNGTARAILQGRKYGLGCLLITQRTANVTKTILNQCNTIFAMRTFDETGKEFLSNYLGKDHAEMLSSLQERQAVVFGRASSCENPVLIRLNDRDSFLRVFREKYPPPELPVVDEEIADETQVAEQSDDIEPF